MPSVLCTRSLLVHVGTSSGLNRSPSRSSSTSSCHWGSGDGGGDSRVGGSRGDDWGLTLYSMNSSRNLVVVCESSTRLEMLQDNDVGVLSTGQSDGLRCCFHCFLSEGSPSSQLSLERHCDIIVR